MGLAERFVKEFYDEYKHQRIIEWWSKLRKQSSTAWTYRMAEFLRHLAGKMDYEQEYEIAADFSWHRRDSTVPHVVIEHENDKNKLYKEEIPKLCAALAPLKVAITYIENDRDADEFINQFGETHSKRIKEDIVKRGEEVFIFLIGPESIKQPYWRGYLFYPSGELKRIDCVNKE